MTCQVKLQPSGHQFPVQSGESILEAALHHGIGLPYGCRNGACGSCIATLISGKVHYPDGAPEATVDEDQIVVCQAHPKTDIAIQVREIQASKDITIKTYPCRAEHLERVSHDVMKVELKLPATERMQFLAGQYIEFILKDGRRRAFSIANAPHEDNGLELHIRHVPGGSFTGHVFDEMHDRALLRIEGPMGSFYLRENSARPVLMMGGGTGIAPLKGMLEHAFYIGFENPIHLFWGVRSKRDLYMDDLPRRWMKQFPFFKYTPVLSEPDAIDAWQGATGLVSDEIISQYPDLSEFDIYMSGPPAMIESATPQFIQHGALMGHMYSDAFEFAKDVLDKIAKA